LSDGLITARGKAHRAGSVVGNFPLKSPAREGDIHAACLFHHNGGCKQCIARCPAGAISEEGHDKDKCGEFVLGQVPFIRGNYHIPIYACGLCQTGVACKFSNPVWKGEEQ